MQVCILLQTVNHASTPPLSFLQARCPSCHPVNSVKALKAYYPHSTKMKTLSSSVGVLVKYAVSDVTKNIVRMDDTNLILDIF